MPKVGKQFPATLSVQVSHEVDRTIRDRAKKQKATVSDVARNLLALGIDAARAKDRAAPEPGA